MKNKKILTVLAVWLATSPLIALATDGPHVVINEIQLAGETATDEFVELYNPTNETINLTGFSLKKFTASGSASNLISAFPEITIAARGYLLIAHPSGYTGAIPPDLVYSTGGSLAANNSVALINASGETVDLVGWGETTNKEDAATVNPTTGQSLARTDGNDMDNNATDFTIQAQGHPSSSAGAVTPGPELMPESDLALEFDPMPTTEPTPEPDPILPPDSAAELNLTPAMLQNICGAWLLTQTSSENAGSTTTSLATPTSNTTVLEVTNPPAATENTTTEETAAEVTENNEEAAVEEVATEPLTYPVGALVLTELYPAPFTEESEWIEIWNATNATIDLGGWTVTDASNSATALSGAINPGTYTLVENPKGKLNNDGDTVTLFDPAGGATDAVTYDDMRRGEAYARDGGAWFVTSTPTKLSANIITGEEAVEETTTETVETTAEETEVTQETNAGEITTTDAPEAAHVVSAATETLTSDTTPSSSGSAMAVSLTEARELEKGTLVRTQGVVSVPPGIFGTRTFYVAGSGMRVYLHGIEVPTLAIGDVVFLEGKIGSSDGETRLVISKPQNIGVVNHVAAPNPETIELGEIGDSTEGWLIATEGVVTQKLPDRIILENDSGTVPVIIKDATNIDLSQVQIGDQMKIVGIVSETQSGFRLMPRSGDDMIVLAAALPEETPTVVGKTSTLTILAGFFVSLLLAMVVRKQVISRKKDPESEEPLKM